ncbi:MAG: hypothetical protein HY569_00705 [Candidatus Magasanikbacteria bacterium]|nr:hypothetical protein [Candidatus Magasanikbacteria bacterium]
MESAERRTVKEDGIGFIQFCRGFDHTEKVGTVLQIRDDFGFRHQGEKNKTQAFLDKAHRHGLRADVKLVNGEREIYVNLSEATEGIIRVEYYLTKDN